MSEIKVGDYVRTKKDNIGKVIDISNVTGQKRKKYLIKWGISKAYYITGTTITKHSPNIIDLIEVGDYVNGLEVADVNEGGVSYFDEVEGQYYDIGEIKSIVTKERFAESEYKV